MKQLLSLILATPSVLGMASAAAAQPSTPQTTANVAAANKVAAAGGEEEIIVTARRRTESRQDVPLVVNAVTAETIEKLNIRNFQEITTVVPGLSLVANANGIGSSSSMRGVNHDVNVSGENGTIQYYMNDAPVPSNLILQAMYDIGQIEVLRGPQGTLRGRATPSGSITVGLRQPGLDEVGGYVQLTKGSASLTNLQGAVSVPIIKDKLAARVAALYDFNRGNRVYSLNSDRNPHRETQSVRLSLRAQPIDALKLGFVYQTLNITSLQFDQMQSVSLFNPAAVPSAGAADYGIVTLKDRKSVAAHFREVNQDFDFYGWNAELDLWGQSLIYVGSHQKSLFHPITPFDTTNFFPALAPHQDVITKSNGTTHEIRLQNKERVAGMFDYVVGYFQQKGTAVVILNTDSILRFFGKIGPFTFPLPVAPSINTTPIFIPPADGKEVSLFGNVTLHVGEGTEIAGGLRRIHYVADPQKLYISCTPAGFAAGACTAAPGTGLAQDVKKTIYNATIRHRFNRNVMVYAATGSSWRPAVQAIGDFSTNRTANEVKHTILQPETSRSYELGLKSDWLNHSLLFNITAYHQKFQNYPFRSAGGIYFININSQGAAERGQFNFISAVPVKVNGVESEIAYRPSQRFNASAVINYSKSKIGNARIACTDALNNGTGAVGSDGIPDVVAPTLAQFQAAYGSEHLAECAAKGSSATFLPKWSGSLQAEYSHPVMKSGDAFLRGVLAWRGKSKIDPGNPFDDVGAYGLLNVFAGIRDSRGGWEVTLYAKNIANTTKITSRDADPLNTGTVDIFLGPPTFASVVGTGSTTFTSRYAGVTVTPPREFGIVARVAFGSR